MSTQIAAHTGGSVCPSELTLERLFAGELEFEPKRQLELHTAQCTQCSAWLRTRRQGFGAFPELDSAALLQHLEQQRPPVPSQKPARASLWHWLRISLSGAAALAALLFWFSPTAQRDAGAGIQLKGALRLRVYRLREGRSEEVLSGSRFQQGDRLRFRVSTPKQGFVSIIGIEADGNLYTAWPVTGEPARAVPTSQDLLLEGAVELDDSRGKETLWLVHCTSAESCISQGEPKALHCPEGCSMTPFSLDKAL